MPALLAVAGNRTLGLRAGPAPVLLGVALLRLGRYDEAAGVLTRCARSCRDVGDRRGQAAALVNLGVCQAGGSRRWPGTPRRTSWACGSAGRPVSRRPGAGW